jgi:hypothetical protein
MSAAFFHIIEVRQATHAAHSTWILFVVSLQHERPREISEATPQDGTKATA